MKVCVIGTGPSGLTTIKQLLDENHEVTCFEKNDNIGGIWYRNDITDLHQMKVYDEMMLTISMKLMGYTDFMIEGDRIFYDPKRYYKYLEAYADKFGLRKCISFNCTVHEVRKLPDGSWCVTFESNGRRTGHIFDAVAICSGPFQKPNKSVTDVDKFTAEVVHSSQYRNNEQFRNKRVLVVGLAESGADLLRQISDVASECTLSIRSYSFLLPRLHEGYYSTDEVTTRAHHHESWVRSTNVTYPMKALFGDGLLSKLAFSICTVLYGLGNVASNLISRFLRPRKPHQHEASLKSTNNLGEPMFPKKLDISTEWTQENVDAINKWNQKSHMNRGSWTRKIIFCKNVSFIPNMVNGKITVNDTGIERIEGKRVYFKDKASKEFDVMVLCTGFVKDFSVLGPEIEVKDNNVRNLYKHAFHPDHNGRLALIGFVRPFSGGIPVCAEMQARYFAQLCSNKLALPSNVHERIQREKAWEETFSALSPQHTESIPSQVMFLDSIAKEIGCLAPMSELIMKPRLLVRHWFYPFNQACYRLRGPHSTYDLALKELMSGRPGPLSKDVPVLALVALSLLPYFIHPKNLNIQGPSDAADKGGVKAKLDLH